MWIYLSLFFLWFELNINFYLIIFFLFLFFLFFYFFNWRPLFQCRPWYKNPSKPCQYLQRARNRLPRVQSPKTRLSWELEQTRSVVTQRCFHRSKWSCKLTSRSWLGNFLKRYYLYSQWKTQWTRFHSMGSLCAKAWKEHWQSECGVCLLW